MSILTHGDIIIAKTKGYIDYMDDLEIGATSIDVKINKLFDVAKEINDPDISSNSDEFRERYLKETSQENGIWKIIPGNIYIAELVGNFLLDENYSGDIMTRSSWARLGLYTHHVTDELRDPFNKFSGKIMMMLTTMGTSVLLRPNDSPASLIIKENQKEEYVPKEEMKILIRNNDLKIIRNGESLHEDCVDSYGNVNLTLDDTIKMYNGKIIDPHKPIDECFDKIEISDKRILIQPNKFFISSSKESVEIPPEYLGMVSISNSKYHPSGGIDINHIPTMQTHGNAPKIDPYPRFKGKITFENYTFNKTYLNEGDHLSEFSLRKLSSRYENITENKSRYFGQNEATTMRH